MIMFNSVFSSIYNYRIYDYRNGKLWIIIEISNIMNYYKESLKITISGVFCFLGLRVYEKSTYYRYHRTGWFISC